MANLRLARHQAAINLGAGICFVLVGAGQLIEGLSHGNGHVHLALAGWFLVCAACFLSAAALIHRRQKRSPGGCAGRS